MAWNAMETAPQTGARILVADAAGYVWVAHHEPMVWSERCEGWVRDAWVDDAGDLCRSKPVAWTHLPPSPADCDARADFAAIVGPVEPLDAMAAKVELLEGALRRAVLHPLELPEYMRPPMQPGQSSYKPAKVRKGRS